MVGVFILFEFKRFNVCLWLFCLQVCCLPGGIRCAVVFVRGSGVFRTLRNEAGVHRVQRFPVTDKTRIHTSTSVVAVLPEPEKVSFIIAKSLVRSQ